MIRFIKTIIRRILDKKLGHGVGRLYKKIYRENRNLNTPAEGEKAWLEKWRQLDPDVQTGSYRIFSRYIGPDMNILPLETFTKIIEPCLDPVEYRDYYEDKNVFDKFFPAGTLPVTIFRKIGEFLYDADYNLLDTGNEEWLAGLLEPYDKIIVKPTVGSDSGKEIRLFRKSGGEWSDMEGEILSTENLSRLYGGDYIVQQCMRQSGFMNRLNPTSVNTIRIMTYRSVVDGKVSVTNAVLRIGAAGSHVDNAHSGGCFCGISDSGELGRYVCDFLGRTDTRFNGNDFSAGGLVIPNYRQVLSFAQYVAGSVMHHRLLALDVMLDENEQPRLIEFNCSGFAPWIFQFTTGSAFREKTDEVVAYASGRIRGTATRLLKV